MIFYRFESKESYFFVSQFLLQSVPDDKIVLIVSIKYFIVKRLQNKLLQFLHLLDYITQSHLISLSSCHSCFFPPVFQLDTF